eukprot:TRINITY_DN38650_c0_g3_i1.p1 TRINITY_DN38650_c0_g3~~TRINITY_DN38650_c0_g3_i1.p1  ORF type:complete len:162 (-),score=7.45 TRINITY_DN38650_c0_g3_i1:4-432(-)
MCIRDSTGRGFIGDYTPQCRFGSASYPAIFINSTILHCTSPAAVGTTCTNIAVEVSCFNEYFTINGLTLQGVEFPSIDSVSPAIQSYINPSSIIVSTTPVESSDNVLCKFTLVTKADNGCLLYTSDAADEEDSVDIGGRRIL